MAKRTFVLGSPSLIVLAALLAMARNTPRACADFYSVFAGGGVITNTLDTTGAHPVGPKGAYKLRGDVDDNLAIPRSATTGNVVGPYTVPPPAAGVTAGPATVAGVKFTPSATPKITWGAGFWDTTGTIATLAPVVIKSPTENAHAIAGVTDPAEYTFSNFTESGVVISLTLDTGLTLAAQQDPDAMITSAEIQGVYSTSLLSGDSFLWSFGWRADSNDLDNSTFTFLSNPSLGLDDGSIIASFFNPAGLTEADGIHQVISPFIVSVTIPISPSMISPDGSLSYTLGGSVDFTAATGVPEPGTLGLVCIGLVLTSISHLRRRKQGEVAAKKAEQNEGP